MWPRGRRKRGLRSQEASESWSRLSAGRQVLYFPEPLPKGLSICVMSGSAERAREVHGMRLCVCSHENSVHCVQAYRSVAIVSKDKTRVDSTQRAVWKVQWDSCYLDWSPGSTCFRGMFSR